MKSATKGKKIESVPEPDLLIIPLPAKFGKKPVPLVREGDAVKRFQLLAETEDRKTVRMHSPVSGMVERIKETLQADGYRALSIIIKNDRQAVEETGLFDDLDSQSTEDIRTMIERAGLVGLGGAQFPLGMKYDRKGKPVKTFIINGAECEPYLTGDYALLSQYTQQVLDGILLADRLLEAEEIVIAVEHANREIESIFRPYLAKKEYRKIRVQIVPNEYPQGGELQLIRTVTGRELSKGTIPLTEGIMVSNVGTVYSLYETVSQKKPLVERVITISGENVKNPGNYRVKIGTPIWHLAEAYGLDPEQSIFIGGGPMMSPRILSLAVPVHKGTLGIVALPREPVERQHCIWCGYCADVCPMRLMPMKYDQFYRRGQYFKLSNYNIADCIECGACEYICPSNVPLIESIKEGKIKLKAIQDATH